MTGNSLEPIILNYSSNTYNGENNYLSIVKNNRIGQSAAKLLILEEGSQTISQESTNVHQISTNTFGNTRNFY